ncbi:hypothetical protein SteCoe_32724 [Stentor coeruleus]|uniref:RING-CH-type domain-containing protein n=1 Tax=Stentor coeruleus TaxID=5963 RepID=A0A1R2AYC9_9CILI|nr:hypothetical protein SteCoe_32724 [Stentor coeruleus]
MMTDTFLEIRTLTWPRETHNLFDHEAKNLIKFTQQSDNTCVLYRSGDRCFINDFPADCSSDTVSLISIVKTDDMFIVQQTEPSPTYQMWIVIKYLPGSSYEMKEGDMFKLGRETLRVKKISSEIEQKQNWAEVSETPGEKVCKICCSEEFSEEDPLVSLCKCSGTMKYIHFTCLKNWLKCKVTTKALGNVSTYQWSDFVCELCKEPLPEMFQFKGKTLSLLEINYPITPYIILEEIKVDEPQQQILYVIGLEETQSVNIGRGTDSEIKLSDISVSRFHAKIKFINNVFYIQDNKSKFGTLVGVCKNLPLILGNEITIQVNRTLISLVVKKPWKCCQKKKILPMS